MSHFVVVVLVDQSIGQPPVEGDSISSIISSASTAMAVTQLDEEVIVGKVDEMLAPYWEERECEPHRVLVDKDDLERVEKYGDGESVLEKICDYYGADNAGQDEDGYYYVTTRNERGYWDWQRVGGRWDGWITSSPDIDDGMGGFNFSTQFESLARNSVIVREMKEPKIPFAIVTPDGEWHQRARMGWFAMTADEKEPDAWGEEVKEIYTKYPDYLAVAVDCHV